MEYELQISLTGKLPDPRTPHLTITRCASQGNPLESTWVEPAQQGASPEKGGQGREDHESEPTSRASMDGRQAHTLVPGAPWGRPGYPLNVWYS